MQSLLDRIGGDDALSGVIARFHEMLYTDPVTAKFFSNVDRKKLHDKQRWFLTMLLCGESNGVSYYMQTAHAHLVRDFGLSDTHFDRTAELLAQALVEAGVEHDTAAEIMQQLETLRGAILGKIVVELGHGESAFKPWNR